MAKNKDVTATILEILNKNPLGLNITEIAHQTKIRRKTATSILNVLLNSGQVEMLRVGSQKKFSIPTNAPATTRCIDTFSFVDMILKVLTSRGYSIEQKDPGQPARFSANIPFRVAIKESLGYSVRIGITWSADCQASSVEDIRKFSKTLSRSCLDQGIYISLGGFTDVAVTEAERRSVDLWDATDLLSQLTNYEYPKERESIVALPVTPCSQELFTPPLLNNKYVNRIKTTLRYVPFIEGSYFYKQDSGGEKQSHYRDEDTIRFLINLIRGHIIRVEDKDIEKQTDALLAQFSQNDPETVEILPNKEYNVTLVTPRLDRAQIINCIHIEAKQLWLQNCTNQENQPSRNEKFDKSVIDILDCKKIFVPQWDLEFQVGPHVYHRLAYAGTSINIQDSIMRCATCDAEDKVIPSIQPAIAVCEECWHSFCKDHIIKCSVCETYFCKDHIRTCLSCGRHFCAEHAIQECDIAERYQRLLELKRIPKPSTIRYVGIFLLSFTGAIMIWSIYSMEMDPFGAMVSLIVRGGLLSIVLFSFAIFGICFTFLKYRKISDKSSDIGKSVMPHNISPCPIPNEENSSHSCIET